MHDRFVPLVTVLLATFAAASSLTGCMSEHPPLGMPNDSVIGFTQEGGGRAIPPQCDQLNQPSHMIDAGRGRPGVAFGCATYSNLAQMLARPADLVAPEPYAGADAALGASAVRAYEEGRTQPLNPTSTTTSVTH
jgi:type IV pilus biogenesis protein CpaD/CtpE